MMRKSSRMAPKEKQTIEIEKTDRDPLLSFNQAVTVDCSDFLGTALVNTMYSCPAARAKSVKVCASNFDGSNRLGNSRYSASLMPAGVGVIMGQEATLASAYGPPVDEHAKFGIAVPACPVVGQARAQSQTRHKWK